MNLNNKNRLGNSRDKCDKFNDWYPKPKNFEMTDILWNPYNFVRKKKFEEKQLRFVFSFFLYDLVWIIDVYSRTICLWTV